MQQSARALLSASRKQISFRALQVAAIQALPTRHHMAHPLRLGKRVVVCHILVLPRERALELQEPAHQACTRRCRAHTSLARSACQTQWGYAGYAHVVLGRSETS